jgi:hypothetical protein
MTNGTSSAACGETTYLDVGLGPRPTNSHFLLSEVVLPCRPVDLPGVFRTPHSTTIPLAGATAYNAQPIIKPAEVSDTGSNPLGQYGALESVERHLADRRKEAAIVSGDWWADPVRSSAT